MRIKKGSAHTAYPYWTVEVDPGEVTVESGRTLPYGTWIGMIAPERLPTVWSPAGYKPRGWRDAFWRLLDTARTAMTEAGWPETLEVKHDIP